MFDCARMVKWMALFCWCLVPTMALQAEPLTKVFLNGVPTPVFFNDGDSFRVMVGPLKGTTARLAGYNTLESYGPTHQWGDWTAKELYFIAKMGTLNARRGVWHCTSDLKKDGYGRILWHCPELAKDQIRKGLAHALSIDLEPADPEYLAVQREAMAARRGMWAHGTPEYVFTSLHSISEGGAKDGKTYNRVVSTRDGHSMPWTHDSKYDECQDVCFTEFKVADAQVAAGSAALRADPSLKAVLDTYSDAELFEVVRIFARYDRLDGLKNRSHFELLEGPMRQLQEAGTFTREPAGTVTCMTYTDFTRRFGDSKAACLK